MELTIAVLQDGQSNSRCIIEKGAVRAYTQRTATVFLTTNTLTCHDSKLTADHFQRSTASASTSLMSCTNPNLHART